jgi:hypothetical protein
MKQRHIYHDQRASPWTSATNTGTKRTIVSQHIIEGSFVSPWITPWCNIYFAINVCEKQSVKWTMIVYVIGRGYGIDLLARNVNKLIVWSSTNVLEPACCLGAAIIKITYIIAIQHSDHHHVVTCITLWCNILCMH